MNTSICLIILAWLCYSAAIFSDKMSRQLKPWMVIVFAIGFLLDNLGTLKMFRLHPGISSSIHGYLGLGALIFMFFHLIAAIIVFFRQGRSQELFSRFSVYAWILWTLALVTGPLIAGY